MFRRLLLLLGLVLLAGLTSHAFAQGVSDATGTAYETASHALRDRGVIQGYPDGTLRPNGYLNRAEALKTLLYARADYRSQLSSATATQRYFYDVPQTAWYAPAINLGAKLGIAKGYPDQKFRPERLVSTEEAITFLLRTFGVTVSGQSAVLSPYYENQSNQWYTPYINTAIEKNLLLKIQKLRPGTAISRGQFFDMVYRMMHLTESGTVVYQGPEPQAYGRDQSLSNPLAHSRGTDPNHPHASEKYFSISMPDLGIDDMTITHPIDPFTKDGILSVLTEGVGHLFSYPGGGGKIMIYGHSSSFPWDVSQYTKAFRKVNQLEIGDKIYVTYEGTLHVYEVTHEQTIDAADTSPFNDNGTGEELILYTCWPPDSIAQRYLVHAVPVEKIALQ